MSDEGKIDLNKVVEVNIPTCKVPTLARDLVVMALNSISNLRPATLLTDTIAKFGAHPYSSFGGASSYSGSITPEIAQALMSPDLQGLVLGTLVETTHVPWERGGKSIIKYFKEEGTLGTALNMPHIARILGNVEGALYSIRLSDTNGLVIDLGDSSQRLSALLERLRGGGGKISMFVGAITRAAWLSRKQLEMLRGTGSVPQVFTPESLAEVGYLQLFADSSVLVSLMPRHQLILYKEACGGSSGKGVTGTAPLPDNAFIWEEWGKIPIYTYGQYSSRILAVARDLLKKRSQASPPIPTVGDSPEARLENAAWEVYEYLRESGCLTKCVVPDQNSLLDYVSSYLLLPNRTATSSVAVRDENIAKNFVGEIYDLFKLAGFHGLYLTTGVDVDAILAEEVGIQGSLIPMKTNKESFLARNPHINFSTPYFTRGGRGLEPRADELIKYRTVLDNRINKLLDALRGVNPFQNLALTLKQIHISAVDLWGKIYSWNKEIKRARTQIPNPWAWTTAQTPTEVSLNRPYYMWQADRYFINYVGGRQQFTREYFHKRTVPRQGDLVSFYCLHSEIQYLLSIYYSIEVNMPDQIDITRVIEKATEVLSGVDDLVGGGRFIMALRRILERPEFGPKDADDKQCIPADSGEKARNIAAANDPRVVKFVEGQSPELMGGNLEKTIRAAMALDLWSDFLRKARQWYENNFSFVNKAAKDLSSADKKNKFKMLMRAIWEDSDIYEAITVDMLLQIQLAFFYRSHGFPVPLEVVDWVPEVWLERGPSGAFIPKRLSFDALAEVLSRASGGKTRYGGGNCRTGIDEFDESLEDVLEELGHIHLVTSSISGEPHFEMANSPVDSKLVPDADAIILRDPRTGQIRRFHKEVWFAFKRCIKYRFGRMVYNRASLVTLFAKQVEVAQEKNQPRMFRPPTEVPALLISEGVNRNQYFEACRDKFRQIDRALLKELVDDIVPLCRFIFGGYVQSKVVTAVAGGKGIGGTTRYAVDHRAPALRNLCDRYKKDVAETRIGEAFNRLKIRTLAADIYASLQSKYSQRNDLVKLRTIAYLKRRGLLGYLLSPIEDLLSETSLIYYSPLMTHEGGLPWDSFNEDYKNVLNDVQGDSLLSDKIRNFITICPKIGLVRTSSTDDVDFYILFIEAILKGLVIYHEEKLRLCRLNAGLIEGEKDDNLSSRERKIVAPLLHLAYAIEKLRINPLNYGINFKALCFAPALFPVRGFIASITDGLSRILRYDEVKEYYTRNFIKINGHGTEYKDVNLISLEAPRFRTYKDLFKVTKTNYYTEIGELVSILGTAQAIFGPIPSGQDRQKDPRQEFINLVIDIWEKRIASLLTLNNKTINPSLAGMDLSNTKHPFEQLLNRITTLLRLTLNDIDSLDLTSNMDDRPVPFSFSNNRPTLGKIDFLTKISRDIYAGEDSIKFSLVDRPLTKKDVKKLRERFVDITYSNPLLDETDMNITENKKGLYYERNAHLSEKIAKCMEAFGQLLKEMHNVRKQARPLRFAYKQLLVWMHRQAFIKNFLIQRMSDKIFRGRGKKDSPFDKAILKQLKLLNIILAKRQFPLIIFDEKEVSDLCQWIERNSVDKDKKPVDAFPYARGDLTGSLIDAKIQDKINFWSNEAGKPPVFYSETIKVPTINDLKDLVGNFLDTGEKPEEEQAILTIEDFFILLCNELRNRERSEEPPTEGSLRPPEKELKGLFGALPGLDQLLGSVPGLQQFLGIPQQTGQPTGQQQQILGVSEILGKVPGLSRMLAAQQGGTTDLSKLSDFHAIFAIMVFILKTFPLQKSLWQSDDVNIQKEKEEMRKKLREAEHSRISKSVEETHHERIHNAYIRLRKVYQAIFVSGGAFDLGYLIQETQARLKDFEKRIDDLAAAKGQVRGDLLDFLRLERRGLQAPRNPAGRKLRILAIRFLTSDNAGKYNCPCFRAKLIEGITKITDNAPTVGGKGTEQKEEPKTFPLPCKVFLTQTLLRRIRQGNKTGTQGGAIISSLTVMPPNNVSQYVVTNVFLIGIPNSDEAYSEPWFVTLTDLIKGEIEGLDGYVRGLDVNQLNCGRPYAHGIVGPDLDHSSFALEDRHISAQDLAVLTNLYCFGTTQWEKEVEKRQKERKSDEPEGGSMKSRRNLRWEPQIADLNLYYGNTHGGPSFARAALWEKEEDRRQAIKDNFVKKVYPAFIFFWRVRQALVDRKMIGVSKPPDSIPDQWKPTDMILKCDAEDSLLCTPLAGHPYNNLPYIEDRFKTGLPSDILLELECEPRTTSFNDEINFVPHYWGEKRSHLGFHSAVLQQKLNQLCNKLSASKSSVVALTSMQKIRRWGDACKQSARVRILFYQFRFLNSRQTSLREEALRYLAKCDAYLSLRFPTSFTAYEGIVFSMKGLSGVLAKAVESMPKDFTLVAQLSGMLFRRTDFSDQLPKYRSVSARGTSKRCATHRGSIGKDGAEIFQDMVTDLNDILSRKGRKAINLSREDLRGFWKLPGEIDRSGTPDWGVDDIYGEIVDGHVNATYNIALVLFKKLEEEQFKKQKAAQKKVKSTK